MTSGTGTCFRETEIRPDHLMKGQAERFAADMDRLLRHRAEFVDVPCPACGGIERRDCFRKYEMNFVECTDCGTMFISPRPTMQHLAEYYATSENYTYWNKYIFPASEETRREKIFKPRAERLLDIVKRHAIRTSAFLEVGSGFGTFCEEVRKLARFERIIAIEPTPELAATCRARGFEVIEKTVEQIDLLPDSIDVIASFEAIEHMFSPRDFVRRCSRMLRPGGALILTCPNMKGFDIVVLRELSTAVDPEHLNYFHPASLSRLLEEEGFSVLEAQTPGQLDAELVRKKILSGDLDVSAQPFLQRVLIEEWERIGASFQQFLADNTLSSHMWIAARKI